MSQCILEIDRTATGKSAWVTGGDSMETNGRKSVQVSGSSNSGTWSAVVRVYASNDARFPIQVAEFTIDQATPSDAAEVNFKWEQFCFEVMSKTGTATKVSAVMSV